MIVLAVAMALASHLGAPLASPPPPSPPKPAPPVTALTFATLPPPWGCIARYESTDNLEAVNPVSGDLGAFQFAPSTWAAYAPPGWPDPLHATLYQQLVVAQAVQRGQGWGAWETAPLCGI